MKMNDEISDSEFMEQVQKCIAILSESQDCMAMLVRKPAWIVLLILSLYVWNIDYWFYRF